MPSPNNVRIWVLLNEAERRKFKSLGGSKWLREILPTFPEPSTRAACAVDAEEREVIANSIGPAKSIARKHGVTVDFVNYMRRKNHGPHIEARRKREQKQCQLPS